MLAPLSVNDDSDTVQKKIAITAMYLDIWLMRRVVNYIRVSYSSTSYTMYLLCKDIRGKSLQELTEILILKLKTDDVTFEGSEAKGRSGIDDLGLNQFSRRYIYHLLARLTAFTEVGAGKPDLFDKYVSREFENSCDIEHIWANRFSAYSNEFDSEKDFQTWRNHVAGLLLLPADVNRSYQDKPFEEKAPHYAKQNLYAASLTESAYQHQPQFDAFIRKNNFSFKPYKSFGKSQQLERRQLVKDLVNQIWSPENLGKI